MLRAQLFGSCVLPFPTALFFFFFMWEMIQSDLTIYFLNYSQQRHYVALFKCTHKRNKQTRVMLVYFRCMFQYRTDISRQQPSSHCAREKWRPPGVKNITKEIIVFFK